MSVSWPLARLADIAAVHDPRGRVVAIARSLLALAELSVLVFTPDRDLFLRIAGSSAAGRCGGVRSLSLWCLADMEPAAMAVCRWAAIVVLAVVAVGFRPRWTCVPHWYMTFSLGAAMSIANGGEGVARILTLLLIPVCLGDRRVWQWTAPSEPIDPLWRGGAFVASLLIRAQVAVVYLHSAVAKVGHGGWWDGTVVADLVQDPYYGAPEWARSPLGAVLSVGTAAAAVGVGVILAEAVVAVLMACGFRVRRWALVLAVPLHAGIALFLGLISFSLVMVAAVALAVGNAPRSRPGDRAD